MDSDPLADIVASQYETWIYPEPIEDVPAWLQHHWQWFDPSHAHRLMWPDRDYRPGMDILVAGCGTNQAAIIAYTNPTATVVAIDVSDAALTHHRHLADVYDLRNLQLHRLPIEEVGSLERDFDLIMSTGVLHHMADPERGIRSLADCLRQEGVLAIMLYARYGRIGVELMQSVFRDLGMTQTSDDVAMVRDALAHLRADHPLNSYLPLAPDLQDDAGIVDTFLHGRERAYSIDECRDLVASAGLVFQDVFLKAPYYARPSTSSAFLTAVGRLPRERQWSIMERVNSANACHFFLACRSDRPRKNYEIDFVTGDPLTYIPFLRKGCRLDGDVIHRSDWSLPLEPTQRVLAESIDGHRTIAEIVTDLISRGTLARTDESEVRSLAQHTFRMLWQGDFVALGIRHE
jgi:SAM-dependent methyltransferase